MLSRLFRPISRWNRHDPVNRLRPLKPSLLGAWLLAATCGSLGRRSSGLGRRLTRALRAVGVRYWDPAIRCRHLGVSLTLPLSHNAPLYAACHRHYDQALPALAQAICQVVPGALVVDVGANVGDTAAALLERTTARVLCVEGNSAFLPFLKDNLDPWRGRWELAEVFLGERNGTLAAVPTTRNGTAALTKSGGGAEIPLTTLDTLLETHSDFERPSLLKIDTDGSDGAILAGARKLLARAQPALFFEYHPLLWRRLGHHEDTIFSELAELGYSSVVLYDNTGELYCEVALTSLGILDDLRRLLLRGGGPSYFDIVAFAPELADLRARFLAHERARFDSCS